MLSCARKFQLRVVEGRADPKGPEAGFGDAVHKCLEFLDKGDTPENMTDKVMKACPSADIPKALSLLTFYKLHRKMPPPITMLDGTPAVEVKFHKHYGKFLIPGSHEMLDIFLDGTIDRIFIEDDILVILDYKTTAVGTPYQIDKTLKSYSLSFQLPFYLYALWNFGILPATYLDYLEAGRYRMEIQLLCYSTSPPTFKTHIRQAFSDDFIQREVPLIINAKIQQAVHIASLQTSAPHDGFCVYKACDNCSYRNACLVLGTAREQEILSRFDIQVYDPLSFR